MTQVLYHQTTSPDETQALAARLARLLRPGDVVVLSGDLGAGKTTFVKGLALGLGIDPAEVVSPTFTLINEYPGEIWLFHFDLYRLEDGRELAELGFDEYLERGGICAIEWGAPLLNHLAEELEGGPSALIEVAIGGAAPTPGGTATSPGAAPQALDRRLRLRGFGRRAAGILSALAAGMGGQVGESCADSSAAGSRTPATRDDEGRM